MIKGLHHAQITVPSDQEEQARAFYLGLLGLREIEKPASLQMKGGFWVETGGLQTHVSLEDGVARKATKAHLAYEVTDLAGWRERLCRYEPTPGIPIPRHQRFEIRDPFGNRLEFIEKTSD